MFRDIINFDWDASVPREHRDELIEKLADNIVKRGLQTPALWMLEIHKPLMPLGGQLAIAFSPMLGPLFAGGAQDLQTITKLMREPGATDQLISLIQQKSEESEFAARQR